MADLRKRDGGDPGDACEWLPDADLPALFMEVPEGIEDRCIQFLKRERGLGAAKAAAGLIELGQPAACDVLHEVPRWSYGLRSVVSEAPALESDAATVAALVGNLQIPWTGWVRVDGSATLPYRFSIEGRKVSRQDHRAWLERIRSAAARWDMADNPSRYVAELILSFAPPAPRIYFKPTFAVRGRFTYRVGDVGASINPVMAAAIVRLIPAGMAGTVIDPTCGSATLLIERGLVQAESPLVGIDISNTAIRAATTNVREAGMERRTVLIRGDSAAGESWQPADIVIANLPFGRRSGPKGDTLFDLYRAILTNAAGNVAGTGRVLVLSSNRKTLEAAISATGAFRVLARYRAQSGGLHIHINVLGRK